MIYPSRAVLVQWASTPACLICSYSQGDGSIFRMCLCTIERWEKKRKEKIFWVTVWVVEKRSYCFISNGVNAEIIKNMKTIMNYMNTFKLQTPPPSPQWKMTNNDRLSQAKESSVFRLRKVHTFLHDLNIVPEPSCPNFKHPPEKCIIKYVHITERNCC